VAKAYTELADCGIIDTGACAQALYELLQ